jgi:hypothetical protein
VTALRPQNPTVTGALPLDRPTVERPHRLYVATTNHCNRACPWCSTCSSPRGATFLGLDALEAALPPDDDFELQLEGGEPTVHPEFWEMVALARRHPRCRRVVVVTNGVRIPRAREKTREWLARLGEPLTVKLSVNHHLLERDDGLLDLASTLCELERELGGDRHVVLNVRLRRGAPDDDAWIMAAIRARGLEASANSFYLQRYGYAESESTWERPFVVGTRFTLLNPDGSAHGTDLVGRSEAMRELL